MLLINILSYDHDFNNSSDGCTLQVVCMPVMDDLHAIKLIRSFQETWNWDAAKDDGIEQS